MTEPGKQEIMARIAAALQPASEVRKVVVFGSFLDTESPNDIDVAVFQESGDAYLPLALKYRRMTKSVAAQLPMDIFPVRPGAAGPLMDEINKGRVIYER